MTIIWLLTPLIAGFIIYLFPKSNRFLALGIGALSLIYAGVVFYQQSTTKLELIDTFGITLIVDELSAFFILTNALVTIAVISSCWQKSKSAFFYTQLVILHGSVNATFVCSDLISLYVALEVISIASFLLITYPRSDRSIWVGLRYLFVSNTAMLFYLVGAILVYKANFSFNYQGLVNAPPEAIALIFLGLLAKGGIFISGLWLPLTHSESESPVSAMLSGVVVKAGVFPLVRFALLMPEIDPVVRFFGVATALLGVGFAVWEKDTKRMLAFHTVSQLGFVLAAPAVGGFYALTHGLVKSALFLTTGILPSRKFKELQHQPLNTSVWLALAIASFSISGFPLLSGFGAKVLTSKNLLPWQVIGMNIAALGTAVSFAKFIFLPHLPQGLPKPEKAELGEIKTSASWGYWLAMIVLLGGLFVANVFYYEAYSLKNVIKPLLTIFLGWLAYWLIFRKSKVKLPRQSEKFEHLIGVMSLMLILLFWVLWSRRDDFALGLQLT